MDGEKVPWCKPEDDHNVQIIISCVYVMFLIFLTLIFSAITWNSDENHHESRWILATTLFNVGTWTVLGILSTNTDRLYRDPAVVIANLANATIVLLCIFLRKVVLLHRYNEEMEEERKSRLSYQVTTTRGEGECAICAACTLL